MRTNIDIDDDLMDKAMSVGPYKTKKDAVEAGLKLLARQAAYREILKWQGKLKWEGDDSIDWTAAPAGVDNSKAPHAAEPSARYAAPPARYAVAPARGVAAPSRDVMAPARQAVAPARDVVAPAPHRASTPAAKKAGRRAGR